MSSASPGLMALSARIIAERLEEAEVALEKSINGPGGELSPEKRIWSDVDIIEPVYPPLVLNIWLESSSGLRAPVDAYSVNIDGFGHRFEPVFDLEATNIDEIIADSILVERLSEQEFDGPDVIKASNLMAPTPAQIALRKKEIETRMRIEKAFLTTFFESCTTSYSFVTLRKRTRQELEVTGNAFWEVVRNERGRPVSYSLIPGHTIRMTRQGAEQIEVKIKVPISALNYREDLTKKCFRKFVQQVGSTKIWFKEVGDPRIMSSKTGCYFSSLSALQLEEGREVRPATEIFHWLVYSPTSEYGVPRWMGALLSVLGSRASEEVNYLYFDNKSVPPMALLVSGGRLRSESVDRIKEYLADNLKGRKNFHSILILEAEGGGNGMTPDASKIKIELRPLTMAQQNDALFQRYEGENREKIRGMFRIPKVLAGDMRDFSRATATSSLSYAETQVFAPEREEFDWAINHRFLTQEFGIRTWRFVSNSPMSRDSETMSDMIAKMMEASVITPEEGRQLASIVFNKDLKKITDDWVKKPIRVTLAEIRARNDSANTDTQNQAQSKPAGGAQDQAAKQDDEVADTAQKTEVIKVPFGEFIRWVETHK